MSEMSTIIALAEEVRASRIKNGWRSTKTDDKVIALLDSIPPMETRGRLEYLRGELRAERISYSELSELQGLVEHIEAGDVELLEAAGVPEFDEDSR